MGGLGPLEPVPAAFWPLCVCLSQNAPQSCTSQTANFWTGQTAESWRGLLCCKFWRILPGIFLEDFYLGIFRTNKTWRHKKSKKSPKQPWNCPYQRTMTVASDIRWQDNRNVWGSKNQDSLDWKAEATFMQQNHESRIARFQNRRFGIARRSAARSTRVSRIAVESQKTHAERIIRIATYLQGAQ